MAICAPHEIVDIDDRSRIVLPTRLLDGLDWLTNAEAGRCLAVLPEPGAIRLLSWEAHAVKYASTHDKLLGRERYEDLRLLEDRYRTLQVTDRRPTLGESLMFHLGLELGVPAKVYIWRVADYLEILTIAARNLKLANAGKAFPDLP